MLALASSPDSHLTGGYARLTFRILYLRDQDLIVLVYFGIHPPQPSEGAQRQSFVSAGRTNRPTMAE